MSNLRSRPIEGYITDNAGNILRNAEITVKEETPTGSNIITTAKADDDGYFITAPVKNGVYDIYESGVRVFRQYHSANPTVLQAYVAGLPDNIPTGSPTFESLRSDPAAKDINDYRHYIQIEPSNLDIAVYGHMFPLWDVDPTTSLSGHPFANIAEVHTGLTEDSRLTHTRFDVEYFNPLDAENSIHRRIRWGGVPAIRFFQDSKLVLPLDYYSIIPNHVFKTLTYGTRLVWSTYSTDSEKETMEITFTTNTDYSNIGYGDIIYVEFDDDGSTAEKRFWGIVVHKDIGSPYKVRIKLWKSSHSSHVIQGITNLDDINSGSGSGTSYGISKIMAYYGMFSNLANISQSTGSRFSVLENTYAQDSCRVFNSVGSITSEEEMYNYDVVPNPNT